MHMHSRSFASPATFAAITGLAVVIVFGGLVHYNLYRIDPYSNRQQQLDNSAWSRLGHLFSGGGVSSDSGMPYQPTIQVGGHPEDVHRVISAKPPDHPLKPTRLVKFAPGWTVWENIYMANGTFFVVTEEGNKDQFPDIRLMISKALFSVNTPENLASREPTDEDMVLVSVEEAKSRWDDRVWPVDGLTFYLNDHGQFLSHYYHFVAETWMGIWRMYSSFDPDINVMGETQLELPSRAIFGHCEPSEWRDYSHFNQFFLHGVFPGIGLETAKAWQGRSWLSSRKKQQKVWRFDRLLLADRSSAERGPYTPGKTSRIVSEAYFATKNESSRWWWEPVRRSILRFSGVEQKVMDMTMEWSKKWEATPFGKPKDQFSQKELEIVQNARKEMPVVITYIVRVGHRRGMIKEDHELLVKSLTELCEAKGWELNIVVAEDYTQEEQVQIAAKTTVMLGIHGNGLTHLVWMPITPISTIIEIFYPGGFAHDYEWTSRLLGMRHFGVWNDTYFTQPNLPDVAYPDGFQGDRIPAYGPAITKLIEDRIEGRLP